MVPNQQVVEENWAYAHRVFIVNNFISLFEGQPAETIQLLQEVFPEQLRRLNDLMTKKPSKVAALLRE